MKSKLEEIIKEMDAQFKKFVNCRAHFPYLNESVLGKKQLVTAPYYMKKGFEIFFHFNQAITEEHIIKSNEIGHWINQNFIIRLYALLEYHQIVSKKISIDQTIKGWEELDLLRRLRQFFSHTSGKYNPHDKDQKKLLQRLTKHFKLSLKNPRDFPISLDTVVEPLFKGCKEYVKGKFAKIS